MTDLVLQPTDIIHYQNQTKVNTAQIAQKPSPIVVIAEAMSFNKRHLQARVLPFTADHADKETLSFVEKLAFFPKVLRNSLPEHPTFMQAVEKGPEITTLVTGYFNQNDGYADELAEFMDGWNNKPVTGYETNMMGFFTSMFVPIASSEISEFNAGLSA
jgi:hypothetical protein